ncbi:MAG: LCP family protein [Candidatus Roizmanbacteria bacterium]|nr:LCP family protein [Candidatus Roizmanbacteria bacterium]
MKRLRRNLFSFSVGLFFGGVTLILFLFWWYLSSFLSASGLLFSELKSIISIGYSQREQFQNSRITFLILGLDQRSDAFESTLLTDTMILTSVDTRSHTITMIPVPRDLWMNDLKTKVNALYFYGEERDNTTGPEFTRQELGRITGTTIEYYLVMNYNDLPELIDLIGGIDVDVAQSFTDNEYPNPDYLTGQTQPIYTSVQFNKGLQHMDGKRALAYVRSRHSESEEGSDISRSKRQTQVFQGIIAKLSDRSLIANPRQMGTVYRFWKESVKTDLSDSELIAVGLNLSPGDIDIRSASIPVGTADDPEAILVNPPVSKYGLWVWEPKDPGWEKLREFISSSFRT